MIVCVSVWARVCVFNEVKPGFSLSRFPTQSSANSAETRAPGFPSYRPSDAGGWGHAGRSPWGVSSWSARLGAEEEASVFTPRHGQTVEQNGSVEPRRPEPCRGNTIKGKPLGSLPFPLLFVIPRSGSHALGVSKKPSGYLAK